MGMSARSLNIGTVVYLYGSNLMSEGDSISDFFYFNMN